VFPAVFDNPPVTKQVSGAETLPVADGPKFCYFCSQAADAAAKAAGSTRTPIPIVLDTATLRR